MSAVLELRDASVPDHAPQPLPGETPWFRGDQEPMMPGVYKRLSLGRKVLFSYWDGQWFWSAGSAAEAVTKRDASLVQNLPWLGLQAPPPQGYGWMQLAAMKGGAR